jgi:hypothetical protein
MPRIPSGGRDPEQEKADKMFDAVKKMYARSGANVGPRQPMSEDMKRRVGAEVDKLEKKPRGGGGSGGASSDAREMQLGSELDPKAMMKREDKKAKGGAVKSASSRADGIAMRGKTRGKMC